MSTGEWRNKPTLEEFFWQRVTVHDDGCWEWTGATAAGYGDIKRHDGTRIYAHRLSYILHNGPLSSTDHVLHHCDTKLCTNPEHLYAGTQQDNMRDLWTRNPPARPRRTHCKRGHEFTPENTYIHPKRGTRHCRECGRRAQRRFKEKRRRF